LADRVKEKKNVFKSKKLKLWYNAERERERERKERKDKFYCSVKNTLIKEIMKINSNQMREMPIHDRGWISSAQSYFYVHFRYKFSVYFARRLSDLQRNS